MFYANLYTSWADSFYISLFLTVSDNGVMTYLEKIRFLYFEMF
jgi:hypothetical protein